MNRLRPTLKILLPVLIDLLLAYVCYFVCRVAFAFENFNFIGDSLSWPWVMKALHGSFLFDTSAILYTNALWIALVIIPWHVKERPWMARLQKWLFVVANTFCVVLNLCDCVYYQYTMRRTTLAVFDEFGNNTNIGSVLGIEFVNHWYLVLLAAVLAFGLWKLYRNVPGLLAGESRKVYYLRRISICVIAVPLIICGMRGYFFFTSSRPLAVANAHQYVEAPSQAGVVLNTPFAIIRTLRGSQVSIPKFFESDDMADAIIAPLKMPKDSTEFKPKNVVILIVESFAQEFIGALNPTLDDGTYKGYTPFADSLLLRSMWFDQSFCNGWVSIDAMPAVLSSLPKMSTSFVLTPYATADIPGIAKELKTKGYETSFFHGAENSSMGFQAFSRQAGFDHYYGKTEYVADPRFGGNADFDGTWAIWDEEFLQYFCTKLSETRQPFLGAVFTASSHHPFAIPERYKDVFLDEGLYPLHKCIRYTDHSLQLFFEEAARQPWYANTIFVLCADHASSKVTHDVYKTEMGCFRVPIIFFDPSGSLPVGRQEGIAQQIDVMPTVLAMLGYDTPFIAFGKNLLDTSASRAWAFNWHNIPQWITTRYLIQYDEAFKPKAVYDYHADPLLQTNLLDSSSCDRAHVDSATVQMHALLQSYDSHFKSNTLHYTR